ncbi:29 kDa ribonucleoprotein A, chloroplastic [Porphyridium purpureum]|uniref:29 kDa ribonucleoprotein A, chloroplastic n=1 Tax=Porphyridium purpureum TaxID=35688 RepID=A0A5J4YNI4_PORPP|nr:29 kDa ribonucleoprotein A, chloroplastic [Porphyridium purpureum]|eukprot:POR8488..scf222_8
MMGFVEGWGAGVCSAKDARTTTMFSADGPAGDVAKGDAGEMKPPPVLRAPPRVNSDTLTDIQSRRAPERLPDLPHIREVEQAQRVQRAQREKEARQSSDSDDDSSGRDPVISGPVMTECGQCGAIYEIDHTILGRRGSRVKCAVCSHVWFQQTRTLKPVVVPEGKELVDYPEDKAREMRDGSRGNRRASSNGPDRRQNSGGTDRRSAGGRGGPRFSQHTVFLGNLPFSADEAQLEDLCRGKASVTSVKVMRDEEGKARGFAFVNVSTADDIDKLIAALQGVQMNGRDLNVRSGNRNS